MLESERDASLRHVRVSRLAGVVLALAMNAVAIAALFFGLQRVTTTIMPLPITMMVLAQTRQLPPSMPTIQLRMTTAPATKAALPEFAVAEEPMPQAPSVAPVSAAPPAPTAPAQIGPLDANAYLALLHNHLQQRMKYPLIAQRAHEEGNAQVHIVFDRAGMVLLVELVKSSGYQDLDQEAVDLVKRSQPLPPIPAIFRMDRVSTNLLMAFSLQGSQTVATSGGGG